MSVWSQGKIAVRSAEVSAAKKKSHLRNQICACAVIGDDSSLSPGESEDCQVAKYNFGVDGSSKKSQTVLTSSKLLVKKKAARLAWSRSAKLCQARRRCSWPSRGHFQSHALLRIHNK